MGNGITGRGRRTRDNWYYLDKLPPRLRLALCHAAFTWDAKWFYDRWNKGKSVDSLIAEIKQSDRHWASKPVKTRKGFKWMTEPSPMCQTKVPPLYPK
jgi:hypothetical protein